MNNIFKVIKSVDLEEILNDNKLKLTLVMFGKKKCIISRKIKSHFINLSKEYETMIFIYIDIDNFEDTNNFLKDIIDTPHFVYFIDNRYVYSLTGGNLQELKKVNESLYQDLLKKQEEARIYNNQEQNINTQNTPNIETSDIENTPNTPEEINNNQSKHEELYKKVYNLFLTKKNEKQTKLITLQKLQKIRQYIKQQEDYIKNKKTKTKNIESI